VETGFAIHGIVEAKNSLPSKSVSSAAARSPTACPPLMSTAQPKVPLRRRAASRTSARQRSVMPESVSASGTFGVITVASGSSLSLSALIAESAMRRAPLVATITGSITFAMAGRPRSFSATTSMTAGSASIPVLSAAMA